MHAIHPNARTTPAVRAEIARSSEPTGVLARRYGVSTETVRKWRKRGPADCQDRSARPHKRPSSADRRTARTALLGRISGPGRPLRRSGRSSALCAARLASRWMTSPLWSRTSCLT